ncbi:MAG: hypothetical protein ACAH80_05450 [Alphaproteobacteria bacterium]
MTTKTGKTLVAVTFMAFLLACTAAQAARIQLVEAQQLALGTMEIPSSGSNTRIVSAAGAGSGTGTYISGTVQEGHFDVYCTQQCGVGQLTSVTLSIISAGIGSCTGMTSIGTFTGSFTDKNGTTSAVTFPATIPRASIGTTAGTSRLNVGATGTYPSTVAETSGCAPTFSVQITVTP